MDESLIMAARAGNVGRLYELIQGNGNLLKSIDDKEFTDTPLHIAAGEGRIEFAMEIMNLKPSFAWKLNQQGLSPIHLAVKNGHKKLVQRLLEINKDVARVKGKKGKTPFHYLCKEGNCEDLLTRFLEACPECIRDVTTINQTALHIAVKFEKLDVLEILIRKLRNTDYCHEVVNRKDKDGNTALHLAVGVNNERRHKMLRLLLGCKGDKYARNDENETALEVAKGFNDNESIKILRGCFIPGISNFKNMMKKKIVKHVAKASTIIFHDMDSISGEDRNALLVILGLLLTATFQASLSPPGSVWQGDPSSNLNSTDNQKIKNWSSIGDSEKQPGTSVMDEYSFLLFYIPTCAVFIITFFLTLALLKPFPRGFRTALQVLLAFLAICFNESISFLAPTELASLVLSIFSVLVFVLMMFMSISYRVSKISVLILGCFLFPSTLSEILLGKLVLVCWLFIFLYDDFWKGTILVLGYGLLVGSPALIEPTIVLGCWLFLCLCRFCIRQCNQRCPVFYL